MRGSVKMEKFEKLLQMVNELEVDFHKFYEKGVNTSGTKLRKGLGDLTKYIKEVRTDILDVRETRKKK